MSKTAISTSSITVLGPPQPGSDVVLGADALRFVADLHHRFEPQRRALLTARTERQVRLDAGEVPDFLPGTAEVRAAEWTVPPPPADLTDRRCEITGPVDRKMMINALNSGARVFMADFEDSCSPTWRNLVAGQVNLIDAVAGAIELDTPDGRHYALGESPATLMVRPRGWHLVDANLLVGGEPVSAALLDFGLFLFHNAVDLVAKGSGPYLYLPKLEGHLEARLWNDVFVAAQEMLGLPTGTIRATVLVETILAALEMDEILYELRDHSAGLNAGRWDYIFSIIKKFRHDPGKVLPDRNQVTMTVPFMSAYADLLVATCHRRGAHAMGGMAAFIPSRTDEGVNTRALAKVRQDKEREARAGHDGTWVAHPDLVPVATEVFDEVLGDRPHQIDRLRDDVVPDAPALLDTTVPGGTVTTHGLRVNVDVAVRYLASWLAGNGAAGIHHLMEDAATAEISRSQIWQWVRHEIATEDGDRIDPARVRAVVDEQVALIRAEGVPDDMAARLDEARDLFERVALDPDYPDFLTIPAYDQLETRSQE